MITACAAAIALSLAATPAQAEAPLGAPVVRMPLGKSGQGLKAPGVKVTTYGKGKLYYGDAGLIVSDVAAYGATRGSFVLKDGIKLKRGSRAVTIKGLLVSVSGKRVSVSGKVGGRRMGIASGTPSSASVDVSRIALSVAVKKLTLTSGAVAELRKRLGKFSPRSRRLGLLSGGAYVVAPPTDGNSTIDSGTASSCRSVAGAPTDPAKPVTAVNIACASLTWHMRDSWITYLTQGGTAAPIAPAASLPAYPGSQHVCPTVGKTEEKAYSYSLPVQSGWWDAATGTGAIFSSGGAHFIRTDLGIDIAMTAIELRFNGSGSQAWTRTVDAVHTSETRIEYATMNAAAPRAGGPIAPGTKLTRLDTRITSEAASTTFGNNYAGGEHFGCVDVGFDF
ncbi:MAG: HtaA domain-containing protein [Thermoleophilaceae bacterium]|nr:HtaA domain-containing protein [Thermoleophilaceae bacterium]